MGSTPCKRVQHHTPCIRFPGVCGRSGQFRSYNGLCESQALPFADTEAREDLAEQIVRAELAGDAGKRVLRKAQLLGKELPCSLLIGSLQVRARALKGAQVALAREKDPLTSR